MLLEASKATFITKQDAHNIVRTLDKARKSRHENDAVSVERLVQELGEKVVIAYKPQRLVKEAFLQLSKEGFLLVIMTNFKAEMFTKHSSRIVCVLYSTHKTNPYGFKLVTILWQMTLKMVN